jgi:hypothetical protein
MPAITNRFREERAELKATDLNRDQFALIKTVLSLFAMTTTSYKTKRFSRALFMWCLGSRMVLFFAFYIYLPNTEHHSARASLTVRFMFGGLFSLANIGLPMSYNSDTLYRMVDRVQAIKSNKSSTRKPEKLDSVVKTSVVVLCVSVLTSFIYLMFLEHDSLFLKMIYFICHLHVLVEACMLVIICRIVTIENVKFLQDAEHDLDDAVHEAELSRSKGISRSVNTFQRRFEKVKCLKQTSE